MEGNVRGESVPASVEGMPEAGILASGFEQVVKSDTKQTILLVEDEDRVRRVMSEVLQLAGYAVKEAEDAEDAMRTVAESGQPLQLLVTDVVLPGKSGRELARELQMRLPGMKAILISGYGENVALMGGSRNANLRYLAKPFSATLLVQAVKALLGDSKTCLRSGDRQQRAASAR